jgi:hypothetical protein
VSSLKVTNLQAPSAASPAIVLAADGSATAQLSSLNGGALSGARNRIINGDMRVDQRNAGASVNVSSGGFAVDRWYVDTTTNASFTGQRNAGSVTPPSGFTNYLGYTSTAAYSPGANTTCTARQFIEGFNSADLAWGTANAQTVTLSFWVRSSLLGTHSGSLSNGAGNRSYVFSFSISAANTWEYKSIVVPGDTTGTWATDNTGGIGVRFNLGTGTGTFGATATGWQAGNLVGLTTAVQISATNGATFYITGVQLEAGSVATPFERRSYGQELALCQRYYEKSYDTETAPGTNTTTGCWCSVNINAADFYDFGRCQFRVTKRTNPTITMWSTDGTFGVFFNATANANSGNSGSRFVGQNGCSFFSSNSAMSPNTAAVYTHWSATSEL